MSDELTALDAAKGLGAILVAMFGFHYKSLWQRLSAMEERQAKTDLALARLPTKADHEKAMRELKEYIAIALNEDPEFHRKKFGHLRHGFVGEFKDNDK